MQKRGNEAECVVPDFLPVLLHSLPYKKQITPDCFFVSSKARIRTSTNKWDRKVRRINKYISLTDDHGEPMEFHSHMLRDTFAVEMLLAGFAMEEVSRLLGHKSIAVTERYYAKWVKSRLRKLEDRVVATWRSQGLTVFGQ
jgi:integrase